MDECLKRSQRQIYCLPWSAEEIKINNYNPLLLMLWKANMDVVCWGIIVGHCSVCYWLHDKAEKSNMQDIWHDVSSHKSVYSKLWSFGVRSLRSRECGLYEASNLLLGIICVVNLRLSNASSSPRTPRHVREKSRHA